MRSEWYKGLMSGEKDIEEKGIAKVEWSYNDMKEHYGWLVDSDWMQGYGDAIKHYHRINQKSA